METRDSITLSKDTSWFQFVPLLLHTGDLQEVDSISVDETARGSGAFGSTDKKARTSSPPTAKISKDDSQDEQQPMEKETQASD
jgi:hypothetical protein